MIDFYIDSLTSSIHTSHLIPPYFIRISRLLCGLNMFYSPQLVPSDYCILFRIAIAFPNFIVALWNYRSRALRISSMCQHVFLAWCFVEHSHNFTFHLEHWTAKNVPRMAHVIAFHVRSNGSVAFSEFVTGLLYLSLRLVKM